MRLQRLNVSLANVIKGYSDIEIMGDPNVRIAGIALDSRKVERGDLYVCIKGFKADGHDYAQAAVAAGAAALVVERFLPLDIPQLKVGDTRAAAGFLAANAYGNPAAALELVGVTGTNGKTTVAHLVEEIARTAGRKTGLIGTLGARIGSAEIPGEHTTPESADLQKLLYRMVQDGVQTTAMEVSSHALDLGRVNGCVFNAAIFTNLSQDHLDYHHDMQHYLEAKSLLFSGLNGQKPGQLAVLNADDAAFAFLNSKAACPVVSYGVETDADYRAEAVRLTVHGVEFTVRSRGLELAVVYGTPGKFSVYNALAALVWGIESGYDPNVVVEALAHVKGVPGRFESVRQGQPFLVIVDYAHTPDGLENVLSTAREITPGRLITVFGCGGDRDRRKRPLMAEAATRWSDYIVVTSDNPRTEDPQQIIADIIPGLGDAPHSVMADRRQAIRYACSLAQAGDTVMIAGKGHEDYQIIGQIKTHFDDREEVRDALRGMGYEK